MKKIEDNNTLAFIVDVRANKRQIKTAVKEMYDIDVLKVRVTLIHARFRATDHFLLFGRGTLFASRHCFSRSRASGVRTRKILAGAWFS